MVRNDKIPLYALPSSTSVQYESKRVCCCCRQDRQWLLRNKAKRQEQSGGLRGDVGSIVGWKQGVCLYNALMAIKLQILRLQLARSCLPSQLSMCESIQDIIAVSRPTTIPAWPQSPFPKDFPFPNHPTFDEAGNWAGSQDVVRSVLWYRVCCGNECTVILLKQKWVTPRRLLRLILQQISSARPRSPPRMPVPESVAP